MTHPHLRDQGHAVFVGIVQTNISNLTRHDFLDQRILDRFVQQIGFAREIPFGQNADQLVVAT